MLYNTIYYKIGDKYNLLKVYNKKEKLYMGKLKNMAYDKAEENIDNSIEKIIKDELTVEKAVDELMKDNYVKAFFTKKEVLNIITHEIKKELNYGGASVH
tara:strand:+ start:167 stop:466 length:300 start_codon:yes stop_codon:yes gene_type:complete